MKKKIVLFLTVIFLISVIFYIVSREEPQVESEISWDNKEIKFSRISFFNTQKERASVNIPEYWEGRYRLKDQGKTVVFANIDNPVEEKELFRIMIIPKEKLSEYAQNNWQELGGKDEVIFVSKLSTAPKEEDEFNRMLEESKLVLGSFKAR